MAQGNDRTMLVAASGSDFDVEANNTGHSHRRRMIIGGTVGLGVALAVVLWRSYGRKDLATPTFKGDSLVSLAESSQAARAVCNPGAVKCDEKLGTYFTKECEDTLLGCHALGEQCCRFCGVGDYKTIPCPELVAKAMAQAATEQQVNEKLCGHGASLCVASLGTFFTKECLQPGLPGCSALGRQCCRSCGVAGASGAVTCPQSLAPTAADEALIATNKKAQAIKDNEELCGHSASLCSVEKTFFTTECLKPGFGCSAYGWQCCRFCGAGQYVECPPVVH